MFTNGLNIDLPLEASIEKCPMSGNALTNGKQ